jgi:hypothetical protein
VWGAGWRRKAAAATPAATGSRPCCCRVATQAAAAGAAAVVHDEQRHPKPGRRAHQPLALGRLLATLERRSQWLDEPMLKVREYDWPAQTWSLVIVVVPDLITKLIALQEGDREVRGSGLVRRFVAGARRAEPAAGPVGRTLRTAAPSGGDAAVHPPAERRRHHMRRRLVESGGRGPVAGVGVVVDLRGRVNGDGCAGCSDGRAPVSRQVSRGGAVQRAALCAPFAWKHAGIAPSKFSPSNWGMRRPGGPPLRRSS